jgi:hypothetical protein
VDDVLFGVAALLITINLGRLAHDVNYLLLSRHGQSILQTFLSQSFREGASCGGGHLFCVPLFILLRG